MLASILTLAIERFLRIRIERFPSPVFDRLKRAQLADSRQKTQHPATFDATDVNNGMIGKDLICFLPQEQKKILYAFLVKNEKILKSVSSKRARLHYYNFLLEKLQ